MTRFRYIFILCSCLTALASCADKDEIRFSLDPVYNVRTLWEIIDTRYCYVEEKGCDWDAIRDEYIAKAQAMDASDPVALFDLCAGMLDSLHDGHVNLTSPFDVSYCTDWYDTFPANFDSRLQRLYLRDYRTAGGMAYCMVGPDSIGYIYYSSFSNAVSASGLAWVFRLFKSCPGLILDVRNNGGGDISNAYRLAAPFFTENRTIGYWQHKTGPGHTDFSAMEPLTQDASLVSAHWDKPVVVLCNRRTYSAANLFVNIMRYAPNATIMGGVSGGGGGMPMSYDLPCGWIVRFSSVRMYDADRRDIENGIEPDSTVTLTSSDRDDIIEAAMDFIRQQNTP